MDAETKIKELQEIKRKVSKWPSRLRKLSMRKNSPMSEAEFCDKYGFQKSGFNKSKNQRQTPRLSTINKVEAALEREGV